jgi:hypothetical protein
MTSSPSQQLQLLDDVEPRLRRSSNDWRLDKATRARGLRGVDAARRALAEAAARREARTAA